MNKKELEILSKIINSEIDLIDGFSQLIPNIEEIIKNSKQNVDLIYHLYNEIAKKIKKDNLSSIKMNKYLACGIIKESISKKNLLLQKEEIYDIVLSMESVEMIDQILNDENLEINLELRKHILTQREELLTHDLYDENGNNIGTIKFSDDEIKALKAYVGEDVGYSFYPDNDCTYMILNAFIKAGNTLGETSAGWQHKNAIISIIEKPEEFMQFALDLSGALHKYGKTVKEPISLVRSEPNAKYILENKKTMSFFSTTKEIEELGDFKHECKDSIITYINHGIDSIDIEDILKGDYSKPEEKEVLIAPFIPFNYKKLSEKVHKFKDDIIEDYESIVGTYELELKSNAISHDLSDEEKREYQKFKKIFLDENLKKQSIEMWKDNLNSNKEPYLKWREAFSKVFSYKQRERALLIDKEIESKLEYSRNRAKNSGDDFQNKLKGMVNTSQEIARKDIESSNSNNIIEKGKNKEDKFI